MVDREHLAQRRFVPSPAPAGEGWWTSRVSRGVGAEGAGRGDRARSPFYPATQKKKLPESTCVPFLAVIEICQRPAMKR